MTRPTYFQMAFLQKKMTLPRDKTKYEIIYYSVKTVQCLGIWGMKVNGRWYGRHIIFHLKYFKPKGQ